MNLEKLNAVALAVASMGAGHDIGEQAKAEGTYHVICHEARPGCEAEYVDLLERVNGFGDGPQAEFDELMERLKASRQIKWEGDIPNVVTTVGKNFALDSYLAGSAYTAAWFLGLISSVSFTAVSASDTMSSHSGWLEAGATNAPTFSGARKTAAWSAASGGSKALSAGLVFTFTGSGTVKGCFLTTVSTVDGTTGVLYSAGLFSGGDQPVVSTNTLTVSYTASL